LLLTIHPIDSAPGRLATEDHVASVSNPRAGRAFVFSGADGHLVWTLDAPDVIQNGRFGETVAGIGDVNDDGVPDIAVGASGVKEGTLTNCGRVYLFSGADGTLLRTIPAPFPDKGIRFGFSVAAVGDLDADGAGDLLVGAPRVRTPLHGRTGAAYLISGRDGHSLATLAPPTPHRGSQFGISVAGGRDVNGDLLPDLIVGAPAAPVGGLRRVGEVDIYDPNGTIEAFIGDPAPQEGARFGESVSIMDDADGDGVADLVIGADGQSVVINDFAGLTFLFTGGIGAPPAFIKAVSSPTAASFANFGFAVAGLSDLNMDGVGDLAGTAPDENVSTLTSVGRAYVLGGDPNTPTIATVNDPAPNNQTFLGGSLAALADLTGDGFPELAVGAELHKDPNGVRAGRAYVVEAKSGNVYLTVESPTGDACARFGWAVAAIDDVDDDGVADFIVGAPFQRVITRSVTGTCF
jgi:hypothetical protein